MQYFSEHKGDPAIVALAERVDLDLGKALWPIEKGSLGVNQVMMALVNHGEWSESNAKLLLGGEYAYEPW